MVLFSASGFKFKAFLFFLLSLLKAVFRIGNGRLLLLDFGFDFDVELKYVIFVRYDSFF